MSVFFPVLCAVWPGFSFLRWVLCASPPAGKGHYGTVYKARNKRTGRVVAVKKIEIARTRKSSLKAEVMVLRDVGHHDNIVGLLDVFITGTHVLLVLEMATGGELFDRLVNDGPYSEKKASFHVGSIAGALAFLHAKGIVHRDLKPENLLLSDKGPDAVLKIADFGLSAILLRNTLFSDANALHCAQLRPRGLTLA